MSPDDPTEGTGPLLYILFRFRVVSPDGIFASPWESAQGAHCTKETWYHKGIDVVILNSRREFTSVFQIHLSLRDPIRFIHPSSFFQPSMLGSCFMCLPYHINKFNVSISSASRLHSARFNIRGSHQHCVNSDPNSQKVHHTECNRLPRRNLIYATPTERL